jgi:glycosyltransferase involved in cell wall biosynthesis
MRILYDGQIYSMQGAGGVNRYFANIISGLPPDFSPVLLAEHARGLNYPTHPCLEVRELGKRRLDPFSYRLSLGVSRLEAALLKRRLSGARFDLAHPTYYTLLTGREVGAYRCPVVLTVWDMIHERFAATMDPSGRNAGEKRRAILAADLLICISENTRRDLLGLYPGLEDRVRVTHLATSLHAGMSHGAEPVPSRPYYLYVGSRSSYKNFDLLLAALARCASSRPEVGLCVVGLPFSDAETSRMVELGVAGRVELVAHPPDSHLAKLYRCSVALVYPSLYEGFGIPPLEAMACGTVAVAANTSSLPEVVGDAGILFDPRALDELTDILLSLMENPGRREALILKGKERAKQFSWDRTAARTVDVYRSLL